MSVGKDYFTAALICTYTEISAHYKTWLKTLNALNCVEICVDFSAYVVTHTRSTETFELVSAAAMNPNHLTNEFMFWHLDTRDSAQNLACPPPSQAVCFPFLLSAVYGVRCIIDTFFPSPLLLLDSSLVLISSHRPHWQRSLESCSEFDPTWSIFYCLVFNTFLKILPHPVHKKKKRKNLCLFQVFVMVRQREMTGGGYSPSVLPVQETGGIIRRGYRGGKSVNVFVCICVC